MGGGSSGREGESGAGGGEYGRPLSPFPVKSTMSMESDQCKVILKMRVLILGQYYLVWGCSYCIFSYSLTPPRRCGRIVCAGPTQLTGAAPAIVSPWPCTAELIM